MHPSPLHDSTEMTIVFMFSRSLLGNKTLRDISISTLCYYRLRRRAHMVLTWSGLALNLPLMPVDHTKSRLRNSSGSLTLGWNRRVDWFSIVGNS